MLILTRRVGESIMIGDDVVVSVLGVKGNQVRIGINAPKDVQVHREEIYERIQKERKVGGTGERAVTNNPNKGKSRKDVPTKVIRSKIKEGVDGNR